MAVADHLDDDALRAAFAAHKADAPKFTRRMAVNIADFFGVAPMPLVWQLEKRGLIRKGSWEWFRENGGITAENIAEVRAGRLADARAAEHNGTQEARHG